MNDKDPKVLALQSRLGYITSRMTNEAKLVKAYGGTPLYVAVSRSDIFTGLGWSGPFDMRAHPVVTHAFRSRSAPKGMIPVGAKYKVRNLVSWLKQLAGATRHEIREARYAAQSS